MPEITTGDVIRATARMVSQAGDNIMNTFHWVYGGADTNPATVIGGLQTALNAMYTFIQPSLPGDLVFADIDIANPTKGDVYAAVPWPSLVSGGGTGGQMPNQNCALIIGRTNASKVIGRKYLGPFIASLNSDGNWSSSILNSLEDFAEAYLSSIDLGSGRTLTPAVAHYLAEGAVGAVNYLVSWYTSTAVHNQRRRTQGVGG